MAPASPSRSHLYVLATVGLMVLAPCGWLLVKWHQVKMQREVVAEIRRAGGTVTYGDPHGPEWLRKLVGDGWLNEVEKADCGSLTTDADLERLKWLTHLQFLGIGNTQITDAGLKHLKGLTQLHGLYLIGTPVTDAGLEQVAGFAQLQRLWLGETKITDAGLEHLKGLTHLEHLWLAGTKTTDAGLEHMKRLTNLQYLDLTDTQVTDTGVKKLQAALPDCQIRH